MTNLPINNEPDGHPGLDRIIQQVKDKHYLKHIHGPYIVTEYKRVEDWDKPNLKLDSNRNIQPGITYVATAYSCSICLEPWEPQP